ncbi:MAG: carboxypeptidase regulatory-like domain-containing protein [bacterium]
MTKRAVIIAGFIVLGVFAVFLYLHSVKNSSALSNQIGRVFGVVRDGSGNPMPGCAVTLYNNVVAAETKTDSEGRYSLSVPAIGQYSVGVDAGDKYLKANLLSSPNTENNPSLRSFFVSSDRPSHKVDFTIQKALVLRGTVRSKSGRPIVHAWIREVSEDQIENATQGSRKEARSNRLGEFQITLPETVLSKGTIPLTASHPDYESVSETVEHIQWPKTPLPVSIVMQRAAGRFYGAIEDIDTGKPIPHFEFTLTPPGPYTRAEFVEHIKTDDHGRFAAFMPSGDYLVNAPWCESISPGNVTVDSNLQQETHIILRRVETRTFQGTVFDKDSRTPIPGVYISSSPGFSVRTRTEGKGRFKITLPSKDIQDSLELKVTHEEYFPASSAIANMTNPESLVFPLTPYPGSVEAILSGATDYYRFGVFLVGQDNYEKKVSRMKKDRSVFIERVNPAFGPFVVVAGNGTLTGRSEEFDLAKSPGQFKRVEVPLRQHSDGTTIKFKIINARSGKPIPAVTLDLTGIIMLDRFGERRDLLKSTISDLNGLAKFGGIPWFVGKLHIHHGLYHSAHRDISHDGIQSGTAECVALEPFDFPRSAEL